MKIVTICDDHLHLIALEKKDGQILSTTNALILSSWAEMNELQVNAIYEQYKEILSPKYLGDDAEVKEFLQKCTDRALSDILLWSDRDCINITSILNKKPIADEVSYLPDCTSKGFFLEKYKGSALQVLVGSATDKDAYKKLMYDEIMERSGGTLKDLEALIKSGAFDKTPLN